MKISNKELVKKVNLAEALLWTEFLDDQRLTKGHSPELITGYQAGLRDMKVFLLKSLLAGEDHE